MCMRCASRDDSKKGGHLCVDDPAVIRREHLVMSVSRQREVGIFL